MAPVYSTLLVCSLSILSAFAHHPTFTDDSKFKNAILTTANRYRSEHGAPDLTWNDTLATQADEWAKTCNWRYSSTPSGQTLAAAHNSAFAVVNRWANERKRYNFDDPGFSFDTNHFTQLVWKDSTSIGCARFNCGHRDGGEDWDDLRWDNPDYDKNDEYDREDEKNDDGHSHDDGHRHHDWDDDNDDDNDDDRDDWEDDRDDIRDDLEDDRDDREDERDDARDDWEDDREDREDWDDDHDDDRRIKTRRVVRRDDDDRARGWYVVCNYAPPGNIIGDTEFKDNVLRQGSSGGGNGGNDSTDDSGSTGGSNSGDDGGNTVDGDDQVTGDDGTMAPQQGSGDNAGVSTGFSMAGLFGAVAVAIGMM